MTGSRRRGGAMARPLLISPHPFPGAGSPAKRILLSQTGGKIGLAVPQTRSLALVSVWVPLSLPGI